MRITTLSVILVNLFALSATATAKTNSHHGTSHTHSKQAPTFEATTNRTFDQLMDDAMEVMDHGMHAPPTTGNPDRDFLAMMIPHHQGAVDMAKGLLLYGKDKRLQGLALQIITDQEAEIQFMKSVLKEYDKQNK